MGAGRCSYFLRLRMTGTSPTSPVARSAIERGSGTFDGGGPLHVLALVGDALPDSGVPLLLNAALLDPQASVRPPMSCSANWKPLRNWLASVEFAKARKKPTDSPSCRPLVGGGTFGVRPKKLVAVKPTPLTELGLVLATLNRELRAPVAVTVGAVPVNAPFPTPNSLNTLFGLFASPPLEVFVTVNSNVDVPCPLTARVTQEKKSDPPHALVNCALAVGAAIVAPIASRAAAFN